MPYYKAEYDANGREVTIQQVRGPDSDWGKSEPGAWIDGRAVYLSVIEENPALIPDEFLPDDFMDVQQIERLVAYLVDNDNLVCQKCDSLFPVDNAVSTGFAGVKCGECANKDSTCDDGGSHDWECTNPRDRHNARVSTRFRCEKCGETRKEVATG